MQISDIAILMHACEQTDTVAAPSEFHLFLQKLSQSDAADTPQASAAIALSSTHPAFCMLKSAAALARTSAAEAGTPPPTELMANTESQPAIHEHPTPDVSTLESVSHPDELPFDVSAYMFPTQKPHTMQTGCDGDMPEGCNALEPIQGAAAKPGEPKAASQAAPPISATGMHLSPPASDALSRARDLNENRTFDDAPILVPGGPRTANAVIVNTPDPSTPEVSLGPRAATGISGDVRPRHAGRLTSQPATISELTVPRRAGSEIDEHPGQSTPVATPKPASTSQLDTNLTRDNACIIATDAHDPKPPSGRLGSPAPATGVAEPSLPHMALANEQASLPRADTGQPPPSTSAGYVPTPRNARMLPDETSEKIGKNSAVDLDGKALHKLNFAETAQSSSKLPHQTETAPSNASPPPETPQRLSHRVTRSHSGSDHGSTPEVRHPMLAEEPLRETAPPTLSAQGVTRSGMQDHLVAARAFQTPLPSPETAPHEKTAFSGRTQPHWPLQIAPEADLAPSGINMHPALQTPQENQHFPHGALENSPHTEHRPSPPLAVAVRTALTRQQEQTWSLPPASAGDPGQFHGEIRRAETTPPELPRSTVDHVIPASETPEPRSPVHAPVNTSAAIVTHVPQPADVTAGIMPQTPIPSATIGMPPVLELVGSNGADTQSFLFNGRESPHNPAHKQNSHSTDLVSLQIRTVDSLSSRIEMSASEFGSLRIDLETQGERALLHLATERATTGELFKRNLNDLMTELHEAGFSEINLSLGNSGQKTGEGGRGQGAEPYVPREPIYSDEPMPHHDRPPSGAGQLYLRI